MFSWLYPETVESALQFKSLISIAIQLKESISYFPRKILSLDKQTRKECCKVLLNHTISSTSLKVARVVNIKLGFTNELFYNLIMLNKWRKIQYLNLDKALAFARNQVVCLKNWKLWRASTAVKFNILCWNFAHVPVLRMSKKGCVELFFLFCVELELLIKLVSVSV